MPDPQRLGGIAWLERTHGALTAQERRQLVWPILRGQAEALLGRLALVTGRRPATPTTLPVPPDTAMVREAWDVAAAQPAALLGHAYRTWAFGRALAAFDGEGDLDEEIFYTAALLHDVGLMRAVTGEDFTLRSAAAAARVAEGHVMAADVIRVRDAIAAHATPGASVAVDGAEAYYVQAGATCDLGGLRLNHLSQGLVAAALTRHPRDGMTRDIVGRITAEADAVPDGRFALLCRTGFTLAIRAAPLPH